MYTYVGFPEIQKFQMRKDFNEQAVFLGTSDQVEKFGDSAWLIPTEWTEEIPEDLAFSFATKVGFEPIKIISGYLISKKSDTEYCYHLITGVCLESGHYGFQSAIAAERALMSQLFFQDIQRADLISLDGAHFQLIESNQDDETFVVTEYSGNEDRLVESYQISDLPFDTNVNHTGIGLWKIEVSSGQKINVKCIYFSQEGFSK